MIAWIPVICLMVGALSNMLLISCMDSGCLGGFPGVIEAAGLPRGEDQLLSLIMNESLCLNEDGEWECQEKVQKAMNREGCPAVLIKQALRRPAFPEGKRGSDRAQAGGWSQSSEGNDNLLQINEKDLQKVHVLLRLWGWNTPNKSSNCISDVDIVIILLMQSQTGQTKVVH